MKRAFFEAPVERVAPRLLGKILVHRTRGGILAGRIVEVEAYLGPHHETADRAAHSHRGPTPRNQVLFGPAAHAYVYSIYGRYYCMNVTCEPKGRAGCILVRALEPVAGLEQMARNRGLKYDAQSADASQMFAPQGKSNRRSFDSAWRESAPGSAQDDKRLLNMQRSIARQLTSGPSRLCQALGLTRAAHNGLDLLDSDSPLKLLDDRMRVTKVLVTRRIGIRHAVELPLRFALPGHLCVSGAKNMTGKCIFLGTEPVLKRKPARVKII